MKDTDIRSIRKDAARLMILINSVATFQTSYKDKKRIAKEAHLIIQSKFPEINQKYYTWRGNPH
jgi:hypothetical protein